MPDIAPATLYRYYMALRDYLEITTYQGKQVRYVAARAMHQYIIIALHLVNPPQLNVLALKLDGAAHFD